MGVAMLSLLLLSQILQWVFMSVPGHPILRAICDRIARHATSSFSNNK